MTYHVPWNPAKKYATEQKLESLNPRCSCHFENDTLVIDENCQYQHYKVTQMQNNQPGVTTKLGFSFYDLE